LEHFVLWAIRDPKKITHWINFLIQFSQFPSKKVLLGLVWFLKYSHGWNGSLQERVVLFHVTIRGTFVKTPITFEAQVQWTWKF